MYTRTSLMISIAARSRNQQKSRRAQKHRSSWLVKIFARRRTSRGGLIHLARRGYRDRDGARRHPHFEARLFGRLHRRYPAHLGRDGRVEDRRCVARSTSREARKRPPRRPLRAFFFRGTRRRFSSHRRSISSDESRIVFGTETDEARARGGLGEGNLRQCPRRHPRGARGSRRALAHFRARRVHPPARLFAPRTHPRDPPTRAFVRPTGR